MTILKYILESKVCSTSELLTLKKEDPKGYDTLVAYAKEQAAKEGVVIEESAVKG